MEFWILIAGLALGLVGAVMVSFSDAWLSRSLLIYLDAVEANVVKVVEALRARDAQFTITEIDLKRDRKQNLARALKTLGWLLLAVGFGLQLAFAFLSRSPA
jgi:hypothetical protein